MPWLLLWSALLAATNAWTPQQPLLLTTIHRTRRENNIHHLQLFGWHLELEENRAIRSPYYNECQFYKGRVLNEGDSMATVTECAGQFYGLLRVGSEEFVLQPTKHNHEHEGHVLKPTKHNHEGHVLRRRDVLFADQPVAYNLTGDTVSDLELELDEDSDPSPRPYLRTRNGDDDDEYFHDVTPVVSVPASGVQGLWLEMAIVADHTMLKFHGRERVKHYILAIMNIVSAIFNDPSLNSNMTLVINKLYLYEEKDPVIRYGNVKKSLEAVNKWNYRHLMKLPIESTGWDAAIWLTRSELGGPSGFAPVGGVCTRTRSAAIDRDEGLTSAFVIAHELAHLLGLTHDGEAQCPSEAQRGSVMAPTVMATLYNYAWSKCSKEQFHAKSKKWWCLHSRSADEGVELGGTKELSHYVFTMDEQCRTEFGEGFSVCKSVKVRAACSRLWCAHRSIPHVCRSKRAPPLEGTPCGHNRWCVDQECQPMPGHGAGNALNAVELEEPETPEWEPWSTWSECSASCGYGVRSRQRQCRFKGGISATACSGASTQASSCWRGVCAAPRDARADACARRGRELVPYVMHEESKQCGVWCVPYKGGDVVSLGELPDGAPCSYERPYDVCFQSACVRGQCNSSDSSCNWCPDGYCNNNTHLFTQHINKGWTAIAVIPHDAHQLSIHIASPLPLHIAFRERKRDKLELNNHHKKKFEVEQNTYLKYDSSVPQNLQIIEMDSNVIDIKEGKFGWEGEAVVSGSLLRWNQTDSDIFISAVSKLYTDLMIMAMPEHPEILEDIIPVEVSLNYSTPAGRTRPMDYRWSVERGPCSVSCGGGVREVRVVRPRCMRSRSCGPPKLERCNMHSCEFVWAPGEWEECSATCGKDGIQERQLFCVPSNNSLSSQRELIRSSVSPALCSGHKPDHRQPCNQIPCPVYWQEMPWTPCSTTCGRGISYRPLICPAETEMLCGPKPRERRRRCRLRRCPPSCPSNDGTQYCELFTQEELLRNCEVPPFRKYCCNACRTAEEHRGAG